MFSKKNYTKTLDFKKKIRFLKVICRIEKKIILKEMNFMYGIGFYVYMIFCTSSYRSKLGIKPGSSCYKSQHFNQKTNWQRN